MATGAIVCKVPAGLSRHNEKEIFRNMSGHANEVHKTFEQFRSKENSPEVFPFSCHISRNS